MLLDVSAGKAIYEEETILQVASSCLKAVSHIWIGAGFSLDHVTVSEPSLGGGGVRGRGAVCEEGKTSSVSGAGEGE